MANKIMEFQDNDIIFEINEKEYILLPRTKARLEALELLRDEFGVENPQLERLLNAFKKGIDIALGDGTFDSIFGSIEDADIDKVTKVYGAISQQYNEKNKAITGFGQTNTMAGFKRNKRK